MAPRRPLDPGPSPVQHFPPAGEVRPASLEDVAAALLAAPRRSPDRCMVGSLIDALRPADAEFLERLIAAGVSANALPRVLADPRLLASYGGELPAPVPHPSVFRAHRRGECACQHGDA